MLEGWFTDYILMQKETRAYPIEPQETSGVPIGSQSLYRYAMKESDYPTLIIAEPISDNNGSIIPVGYYELAISDDWKFLILMQTKKPVAVIPVFKIEEDQEALRLQMDKDYIKKQKKIQKEREKTNKKRARVGMPPDEEKIHMEASIEYNPKGAYYLIKYERGTIRAWGAIKR